MAGLYAPLPTLRSHPRGGRRTDRGRRGLLLLHRSGLSPHTPCRSPGALTRVAACTLARSPYFVTRYPKVSDISSPPCLLRLLPAGAVAGWGLHPLESAALSRRLETFNADGHARQELESHFFRVAPCGKSLAQDERAAQSAPGGAEDRTLRRAANGTGEG